MTGASQPDYMPALRRLESLIDRLDARVRELEKLPPRIGTLEKRFYGAIAFLGGTAGVALMNKVLGVVGL